MKRLYLLAALVLVFAFSFSAIGQVPTSRRDVNEAKLYSLSGHVTDYVRSDSSVLCTIDFELVNVSDRPIILWKRDGMDFSVEPTYGGKSIYRTGLLRNEDLIEDHYGGPSLDYQDKWASLRKKLDVESPPDSVTMSLEPGGIWRFSYKIHVLTDENPRTKDLSFDEYLKLSPFYLRAYFLAWDFNIDPKGIRNRGFVFGEKLQKRWKEYGHLVLRDMTSEAIEIDFRKIS